MILKEGYSHGLGPSRTGGFVEGEDRFQNVQPFRAGDRRFLETGAGPHRGADERRVAPVPLGILETLDARLLHVLGAVPLQWRLLDTRQAQPAMFAPDLDVRVIALV